MIQLEEWTSLKCSEVLFDTNIDQWSENTSVFNEKIMGKSKISFLIETEDGYKFGYYLNTEIKEEFDDNKKFYVWTETDDKTFEFNLQSNGDISKPMKYEIKLNTQGYRLSKNSAAYLISMGDIWLYKENKKHKSYCVQDKTYFYYHDVENALCGKIGYNKPFTPKRIVVIQMS